MKLEEGQQIKDEKNIACTPIYIPRKITNADDDKIELKN